MGHGLDARYPQHISREPLTVSITTDKLTFRMIYAFTENYVLPLS